MPNAGRLCTANGKIVFIDKYEAFSLMYMTYRDAVSTPGLADNLRSCQFGAQMNLMLSPDIYHQSESTNKHNQEKAKRTNIGFSSLFVLCLGMSLL